MIDREKTGYSENHISLILLDLVSKIPGKTLFDFLNILDVHKSYCYNISCTKDLHKIMKKGKSLKNENY